MNHKDRIAAGRGHFAGAAAEAPDEVIDRLIQSVNLGQTVLAMFDALTKTREMLPQLMGKSGHTEDDVSEMGSRVVMTNRVTGDSLLIQVSFASAEDIEAYRKELEEADPFPDE